MRELAPLLRAMLHVMPGPNFAVLAVIPTVGNLCQHKAIPDAHHARDNGRRTTRNRFEGSKVRLRLVPGRVLGGRVHWFEPVRRRTDRPALGREGNVASPRALSIDPVRIPGGR